MNEDDSEEEMVQAHLVSQRAHIMLQLRLLVEKLLKALMNLKVDSLKDIS
jgi:hypothetical protein